MPCHQYQKLKTEHFESLGLRPVLNGGCKENPSGIACKTGDVNLDQQDFDPQEKISLYDVTNFVQGSLLDIPFDDKHFGIVVLGEILEHAPISTAEMILKESREVLQDDGVVIVTVPLDSRPPEVQHEQMITWDGGITNFHQTVWNPKLWKNLLELSGFEEIPEHHQELEYGFCKGFGAVLRKVSV